MDSHKYECGHDSLSEYCVKKSFQQISHLKRFSVVRVFTFKAILKLL